MSFLNNTNMSLWEKKNKFVRKSDKYNNTLMLDDPSSSIQLWTNVIDMESQILFIVFIEFSNPFYFTAIKYNFRLNEGAKGLFVLF